MHQGFKIASLSIFFGMSVSSFAMPIKYLPPGRAPAAIKNNTSSDILHDSHSANEFYVMPPRNGAPKVVRFSGLSALLPLCDSIATEMEIFNLKIEKQKVREATLTEYKLKLKEILLEIKEADELYKKAKSNRINRNNPEFIEYKLNLDILETELKNIDLEIDAMSDKNSDLYKEKILKRTELNKEILSQKRLNIKLELAAIREQREEDFAKDNLESCKENENRYKSLIDSEEADSKEEVSIQKTFGQYAEIYGAMLALVYTSNWDKNIVTLRQENPGKNFSAVQTKSALYTVQFVNEKFMDTLPIIINYVMNGSTLDPQSISARKTNSLAFTSTAAINANLNLIGACPYYKPEIFGIKKDASTLPILNFSADYIYFAAYNLSVTAKYNYHQVYQNIIKTKTKNGLFKTGATKEEIKDILNVDDIEVILEEDTGRLSNEEKEKIKTDIKARVVGRLMQIIGTPVGGQNLNVPDMPVPERGAVIASDVLSAKKICSYQTWLCRTADWWIITLSNSIGGKTNESIFRDTYNVVVTEKLNEKVISEFPGSTVFAEEK